MAHPINQMLEAETEADHLRMELAEARHVLQRYEAALQKLQDELAASRAEVVGARAETVQLQGLVRRSEEAAEAVNQDTEISRLGDVIAGLTAEISSLRDRIDLVYASASWRLSAPVRAAGRLTRFILSPGLRRLKVRPLSPALAAAIPSPPVPLGTNKDPNPGVVFQVAPSAGDGAPHADGVVTLDELYHHSRKL